MEIFGIIILIANIWAIYNIITSGASTMAKVLWTLFVLIAPVIGFIVWFIAGPKNGKAAA